MKTKQTFKVQTRQVTIYNRFEERLSRASKAKGVITGEWETWCNHTTMAKNIDEAIKYVIKECRANHIGGIVVIRKVLNGVSMANPTKIFQAKWGTDNKPFVRWESNPSAAFWRQKVIALKVAGK